MDDIVISDFRHNPPEGYFYSFEEHKKDIVIIWINNKTRFHYNDGEPVRSVWGFWKSKKQVFLAPVNSKTPGKVVDFEETTNYTAMKLKLTPLEANFK